MNQFDHLILLIGKNPLPNYVTAKYFLRHVTRLKSIIAACSKDTREIAGRLEKVLRRQFPDLSFDFNYIELDNPSDAIGIRLQIQQVISTPQRKNSKIHLNYTGGTKNMVVHAYLSVFVNTAEGNAFYSYLDAREFRLKYDENQPDSPDLRPEIDLPLQDLLELHDCDTGKIAREPDWTAANAIFQNWIIEGLIIDFLQWRDDFLTPYFFDTEHRKIPAKKLNNPLEMTGFSSSPFFDRVNVLLPSLPPQQSWHFADSDKLILAESGAKYDEWFKVIEYLDGKWLEYYIYDLILQKGSTHWKVSWGRHVKRHGAARDFEIDVLVLNGYQLCGISVTTANRRSHYKTKAFEILHRVTQMGGEEARAVLVTTIDKMRVEELKEDVQMDTGAGENLLILGLEDLRPDMLWPAIHHHITGGRK